MRPTSTGYRWRGAATRQARRLIRSETSFISSTTFACRTMLEISTYDRVNIKINLLGNFFRAVRSTTRRKVHLQVTSVPPQSRRRIATRRRSTCSALHWIIWRRTQQRRWCASTCSTTTRRLRLRHAMPSTASCMLDDASKQSIGRTDLHASQ